MKIKEYHKDVVARDEEMDNMESLYRLEDKFTDNSDDLLYVIDDPSEINKYSEENVISQESVFSEQVSGSLEISDSRITRKKSIYPKEKNKLDYDRFHDEEDNSYLKEESTRNKISFLRGLKILTEILLNPANGWRMLLRSRISEDTYFIKVVCPLSFIAGLSEFAAVIYGVEGSLFTALTNAVSVIVSLIAGYFSVIAVGGIFIPKAARYILRNKLGKLYTGVGISSLALFYTLYNCIPMLQPILVFLPLWTIFILFKGIKIFRFENVNELAVIGAMSVLMISLPACWLWILEEYIFNAI